jgi:NAD(P)H-flavin reductase
VEAAACESKDSKEDSSPLSVTPSAPLYQVLQHALADKTNKTKFKLLFANVTEADILLREEFDAMKKKHPDNFDVVYVLDKPPANWKGDRILAFQLSG